MTERDYSATPLAKKLGIKPGSTIAFAGIPADVKAELTDSFGDCSVIRAHKPVDLVLLFVRDEAELRAQFSRWAKVLRPAGSIWSAWPKKSSAMATDVNENTVRDIGLTAGLVDNKICSINATWSALRFVIRVKDRPKS